MLHYERHFSNHPPRVISSYKKACYLYSLFFGLHGKFILPSTHGRLYEKWALPEDIKTFQVSPDKHICKTLQRFVLAIEKAITAVVASTQHRAIQAPYESVIFSSPVWSTAPSVVAQSTAGDQASLSKEQTAVSRSRWNREPSENSIAARPSSLKSIPQAKAELEVCDSVIILDEHSSKSNVRADSGAVYGGEHETNDS